MNVFMLKDVERVGFAGEIIKVSAGYAKNFLFPRKLAVEITPANKDYYAQQVKNVKNRQSALESKTSMLAEKIKTLKLELKKKAHDDDKLYAAVNPAEVVELLKEQGISVSKSQIIFDKSIKTKGTHSITIKLSSTLKPTCKLKVVSELAA